MSDAPSAPDPLAARAIGIVSECRHVHVVHSHSSGERIGPPGACADCIAGGLAAYVRDLATALRAADHALEGSQQFMLSTVAALGLPARDVPAATRSLMFEVAHARAQVRALAPPERP